MSAIINIDTDTALALHAILASKKTLDPRAVAKKILPGEVDPAVFDEVVKECEHVIHDDIENLALALTALALGFKNGDPLRVYSQDQITHATARALMLLVS